MRAFEAFGVGTAKSGTHSLYELCRPHYRSAHEAHSDVLVPLILQHDGDLRASDAATALVANEDEATALDMNSSQLNYYLLPAILRHRPNARFILTIRDCLSWVESLVHHITFWPIDPESPWVRFRELRFGSPVDHPPEEHVLADAGLSTLSGYFDYWSRHNDAVLSSVPRDRLLVVRTDRLSEHVETIAEFLDVPTDTLTASAAHSFAANRRPGAWLDRMDRDYLRQKVHDHCAPLMTRWFPDILEAM
jgi:Sulfotransferase domain